MSSRKSQKMRLSKGILEMKFMKRSKERVELEQDDALNEAKFSDFMSKKISHGSSRFIIERSYVPCEDLIVGRLSYLGMNPEIEEIMKREEELKAKSLQPKLEADVTDQEMAQHFTNVGTVSKKFEKKRNLTSSDIEHSPPKKPKFLKPAD